MAVDYEAIAAKHIIRPRTTASMPRVLIYAQNKKGKTTFSISAGVDTTLVLDPEGGTKEMKTKNPHVWPIEKWDDLDEVINYLKYGKHPYKWVSVDGLTKLSNMALRKVMALEEERSLTRIPGLVQQRDYGKGGELMKDAMNRFHNLPLGVVYTAQERQVEGGDSEEDVDVEDAPSRYVPDLPKGVKSNINALVDVIGRLYVVQQEIPDSDPPAFKAQRRLWIGDSVKYDTGARSDHPLPRVLENPSLPRLVRLIRTGSPTPPTK